MHPGRVDGIVKMSLEEGVRVAEQALPGANLVVRGLHPGDIPPTGTTQRLWIETTGTTTDQFVTAAIGDGTTIRTATVLVIYGARWVFTERHNANGVRLPTRPPVSSVRFVVGGTRVAEWDLWNIFESVVSRGGDSSVATDISTDIYGPPIGIAESPVIVKPRSTLLIQYYEMCTAATDFGIQLLGHVIEEAGGTDGLNP